MKCAFGRHGVLVEFAQRIRRAVGSPDVLVHEYVDVDDSIVLARLADFRDSPASPATPQVSASRSGTRAFVTTSGSAVTS
jgi:hypothetical protein